MATSDNGDADPPSPRLEGLSANEDDDNLPSKVAWDIRTAPGGEEAAAILGGTWEEDVSGDGAGGMRGVDGDRDGLPLPPVTTDAEIQSLLGTFDALGARAKWTNGIGDQWPSSEGDGTSENRAEAEDENLGMAVESGPRGPEQV